MTACKNISPEFVRDIESIVGSEFCHVGDAVNEDFTRDEMPIYGSYAPDLVCEPNSTEQVAAIMRTCYEADVPVTVRGAGTGLVSGCVALNGGVVLCTMRMNEIIEYDMNNLFVRVQPHGARVGQPVRDDRGPGRERVPGLPVVHLQVGDRGGGRRLPPHLQQLFSEQGTPRPRPRRCRRSRRRAGPRATPARPRPVRRCPASTRRPRSRPRPWRSRADKGGASSISPKDMRRSSGATAR